MPDAWEILYQLNPADGRDAAGDFDADGVSNLAEYNSPSHTSPRDPNGNGPNVIYLKANNGSDPAKDGSWGHPYADFATALNSVPDGGKLVIVGSGGSISLQGSAIAGGLVPHKAVSFKRQAGAIGIDGPATCSIVAAIAGKG